MERASGLVSTLPSDWIDETIIPYVGPEDKIMEGDTIVGVGKKESLDKLEELVLS